MGLDISVDFRTGNLSLTIYQSDVSEGAPKRVARRAPY